jgi:hypothetical protein
MRPSSWSTAWRRTQRPPETSSMSGISRAPHRGPTGVGWRVAGPPDRPVVPQAHGMTSRPVEGQRPALRTGFPHLILSAIELSPGAAHRHRSSDYGGRWRVTLGGGINACMRRTGLLAGPGQWTRDLLQAHLAVRQHTPTIGACRDRQDHLRRRQRGLPRHRATPDLHVQGHTYPPWPPRGRRFRSRSTQSLTKPDPVALLSTPSLRRLHRCSSAG